MTRDFNLAFGWSQELISVDSDLYRAHPDWAIQVPGYEHTYSRNQLVLDFANKEVVSYIKQVLDDLLGNHEIDYIKWDMNRNITKLGNGKTYLETKMQSHAYILGLYEVVSYLTEKYENILFESCSGGGGRNDLGMMRYFPQVWASDNTDAIARLPIQYGSSYLYPTISMGAHVSAVPNHQMERMTPLETRGHVAMMGNLGYELDLTSLPQEELDRIAAQVAHYKTIRPVVQFGKHYRLINPSQGSNQAAVQFTHQDRTVLTYVRVLSTVEEIEPTLKLKGLEEDALYSLEGTDKVYSGAELMYAGLTVVLPSGRFPQQTIYFCQKIKGDSQMKWYKKIGLLATTGLALFGLGACSNDGKSADGTVTIEYFNQKKEMTKTLEEIARDFEKENPKVKVKVVNVPNGGEVLKTRVLAGDVPDVVNIYPQSIELQEWAKAGVFEDLSNKDYLKRMKNGYAEKYAVNGKVYNVPFTANAYGIYYNKDKFEELGLKIPETWDEFEQLVKDIVAKGQTPFGIAGADAWTLNGYNQLAFATAAGGGKEANQYLRYSQPNAIKLSDPIMKDDIKVMDILRIKGSKQKNWEGAGYTDVIGAFARGDVLMTPNGSWAITAINEQKPKFKIGTFMIPGKEKGQSLTVGAGDLAWSISATTKHPKEANAFVEYMTRPEVMQKYYDVDGSPTAIEGVKQAGEDSPLAGMTKYAFTDRHLVWLQQYWTSEADFHTLTMNYVLTGDKQGMVNDLNAFFNPMKADVD